MRERRADEYDWADDHGLGWSPGEPRSPRRRASHGGPLLATLVVSLCAASIALAQTSDDPRLEPAAGEGDPLALGERNPERGSTGRETAIVVNRGAGALAVRPSNVAKGGRAISATCDNDGTAPEDGCAVYVNKGTGAAATFRTNGSVPFAIRDTNDGMVEHLFAERSLTAATAQNADTLDGSDSTAFLGAQATAANAEAVDGKDSSELHSYTGAIPSGRTVVGYAGAMHHVDPDDKGDNRYTFFASFPVPAAQPLSAATVHVDGIEETGNACQGSETAPTAPPGHACLYPTTNLNVDESAVIANGSTRFGFDVEWQDDGMAIFDRSRLGGVWAYTAP